MWQWEIVPCLEQISKPSGLKLINPTLLTWLLQSVDLSGPLLPPECFMRRIQAFEAMFSHKTLEVNWILFSELETW